MEATDRIHLTFDIDWAPEFILDELLALLTPLKLPFTLFCTHASPAVRRLRDLPNCETALHPNLMDSNDEDMGLGELHGLFPDARGLRVHRLYYHSGLLSIFHRRGFNYFSNDLMFVQPALEPYYDWSGLVRLPIFWEDDIHATVTPGSYDLAGLSLDKPGLKVFNFHPVHLYLNTEHFKRYASCKDTLSDQERTSLSRFDGRGCRTLFEDLVDRHHGRITSNLLQVTREFTGRVARPPGFSAFMDSADG